MKRFALWLFVLVVLGGASAAWLYLRVHEPYRGYTSNEQFVDIPTGAGSRTIGDRLVDAGVIRDRLTYRAALWLTGQSRRLKAGEYRFDRSMTPLDVIEKIARGDVHVVNLTIPEGLTIADMARSYESHGLGPAGDFIDAAADPAPIRHEDPGAADLEGYLFPETYALSRHIGGPGLVRLMIARFDRVFAPELREAAEVQGLSVHDAVTLASIVEKETARPEERPLVAAVYANRLRVGMPLQCDPTVIYALQRAGKYTGNLTRDDLSFDSRYNTYRYPGLPPGPIASPGRASLDAAVHPADVDFLYFVSRNDGSHQFARTLQDHNRNVQKYQRAEGAGGPGRAGGAGGAGRAGGRTKVRTTRRH